MIRHIPQRKIFRVTTDAKKNGVDGIDQTALIHAIVNGGGIAITPKMAKKSKKHGDVQAVITSRNSGVAIVVVGDANIK